MVLNIFQQGNSPFATFEYRIIRRTERGRQERYPTTVTQLNYRCIPHRHISLAERSRYSNLARPERFELPTSWFVAKYSIQLSYGRLVNYRGVRNRFCRQFPTPRIRLQQQGT